MFFLFYLVTGQLRGCGKRRLAPDCNGSLQIPIERWLFTLLRG